ncbi:hypothetical protein B0H17DRAFT_1187614 [Mycena rosella]|uniref:MYND-type domain-containing protein n=1 Tax=Mycena rosella TaxID=1033263 RepID=A0AAD7BVC6_MYCRO|nr:hypothetical protein B0H17DRAFT_1187614 [Mycena rosella]
MDRATRARMASSMYSSDDGRPLSQLMKTKETLKGAEAQRLRTYCTSNTMQPARDMDEYGLLLGTGDVSQVRAEFERRVARHKEASSKTAGSSTDAAEPLSAEASAAQEIYALCWGPTLLPIYLFLLHLRALFPGNAAIYLEIARFLIQTARVPIDGADVSGSQALSIAISTKPLVDFEYAQLLYDAGGDVNNRNRYGATTAHEIILIWDPEDKSAIARATGALEWFLAHGGNVNVADSDGLRVRNLIMPFAPGLDKLIAAADRERKVRAISPEGCCGFCGRNDLKILKCGKCKAVQYCVPSVRACQKLDWPYHKKNCVQAAVRPAAPAGGLSFLGTKFTP